jgi:hypothetical protein
MGCCLQCAGLIVGQKRLALIKIGYKLEEQYSAHMFQVTTFKKIHTRLEVFLLDSRFTFCGCNVGGDIANDVHLT